MCAIANDGLYSIIIHHHHVVDNSIIAIVIVNNDYSLKLMMMTMTSPTITYPSHTNPLLVVTISTYQSSPSIRTPLLSLLYHSHNSHPLFDSLTIIATHLTFYLHCHSYDDYSFSTIN